MAIFLELNSVNYGSTGKIMCEVACVAEKSGFKSYVAFADSRPNRKKQIKNQIIIGDIYERKMHLILGNITGLNGCFSHIGTYRFLRKLDKIKPEIMHLHNLHNCYINLPMLFRWIKRRKIKVIWTLHDCWAFTAQCPHFQIARCDKWKTGCFDCTQYKSYPESRVDRTKTMYNLKKKWFTGVENMTIVTPSEWLAGLVKESYLKGYPVKVINNGIDLKLFKPTESDFREKNNLQNKIVLLGVASPWSDRKGLDVFIELSRRIDSKYQIVLVGLSKVQKEALPQNIIGIERTSCATELAKYYTMADVFVNLTREDNFPTVNIEALACGTPVITFKTGGSAEMLNDECGCAVKQGDVDELCMAIENFKFDGEGISEACTKRAKEFDMNDKFEEYVKLYE